MVEKKFIITDSQIDEIEYYLKVHALLSIKKMIRQLPMIKNEDDLHENKKID